MNNWFERFKKLPENIRQDVISLLVNKVSNSEIEDVFSGSLSQLDTSPINVTESTIGLDEEDLISDTNDNILADDGTDTFQRRERKRFEKLDFIAKGTFGEVWRVEDRLLKRTLVGKFAKKLTPSHKFP